ncbi:MAG: hypothetical protein R3D65_13280 [Zhengella sp.]|uniref:hypothetical protein n=1 Tax=Zhengella sp. TaxID=2282762 RepID=UPI003527A9A3
MDWKYTRSLTNKAALQLGINEICGASFELVDRMTACAAHPRSTRAADARQNLFKEDIFCPRRRRPISSLPRHGLPDRRCQAIACLQPRLASCDATFDPRADSTLRFLDTMTNAIGSTSDILRDQIELSMPSWFWYAGTDDRFWFAYGQLYALNIAGRRAERFSRPSSTNGLSRT